MNYLKNVRVFGLVLAVILLGSCNIDIFNSTDDSDNLWTTEETNLGTNGKKISYYLNGELKYYEELYYDLGADESFGTSDDTLIQFQHYSASGTLSYIKTYTYNSDGDLELEVYYDSSKTLDNYTVYTWTEINSEKYPLTKANYKANNDLISALSYVYDESSGSLSAQASYGTDLNTPENIWVWTYDAQERPSSWIRYISASSSSGTSKSLKSLAYTTSEENLSLKTSLARSQISGLTAPSDPEENSFNFETDPASSDSFNAYQYKYWYYDSNGTSQILLDSDYFPLEMERTDSQVASLLGVSEADLKLSMEWEDNPFEDEWKADSGVDIPKRLSSKTLSYNNTTALTISVDYNSDNGFPSEISTAGSAMLVPLDFNLTYNSNNVPSKLEVKSNGATLRILEYSYNGSETVQPSSDPMQLLGFVKNVHTIKDYDGDEDLVETFTFVYDNEGDEYEVKVNVTDASNSATGYYLLNYNNSDFLASVKSYNAENQEVWSWSYDYESLVSDADKVLRVAETYLPDETEEAISDAEDYFSSLGTNFIYQLIFN